MWIALGRILPSDERTRLSWHERFAFVYFMQVAKSPISQGVQKGKAPACGSNRSEWQTLSFWSNCLGWGSTRWRSTARAVGWTPSCHAWEKRTWFVSRYFTKWASLATWCPRQYRRRKRNGWFWGLQILETKIQQVATLRSLISGDNIDPGTWPESEIGAPFPIATSFLKNSSFNRLYYTKAQYNS